MLMSRHLIAKLTGQTGPNQLPQNVMAPDYLGQSLEAGTKRDKIYIRQINY
jgi:hypothetical protein